MDKELWEAHVLVAYEEGKKNKATENSIERSYRVGIAVKRLVRERADIFSYHERAEIAAAYIEGYVL